MLRTYKAEINPTDEQMRKIIQTIGNCRFIYNYYLAYNKQLYANNKNTNLPKFISGYTFSKMINNDSIFRNTHTWLWKTSSKAIKTAIMQAEKAFKNFFNHKTGFPKFKKKHEQNVKIHLPKNNSTDLLVERHRIKVPTFGWIRLKEKGYIPTKNCIVKSCVISQKANKFFISVLVDINIVNTNIKNSYDQDGIGIDLGVKNLAICSNNIAYKNINKSYRVKKLKKKIKRMQRRLSKKILKKRGEKSVTTFANIDKCKLKLQKLYVRLINIRTDYMNKVINDIVKRKPSFIVIEDLNIKGMMKNRHLSRAIHEQSLFAFKIKLLWKCLQLNIELRQVDRFYPSSKICSCCGNKKNDLKLNDRIYKCTNCGLIIDRDANAAINLQLAKDYIILT